MEFGKQQQEAIAAFKQWFYSTDQHKPQIFRLFGYAGTGKTFLAKEFREIVEKNEGEVLFAAFSGKAAQVLRNKGCEGASTIHSLIYKAVQDESTGKITWNLNRWDSPLNSALLLIVDECSMVADEQTKDLLSFGVPILVLGDPFQLPALDGTGFLVNGAPPDYMLTDIHRQAKDSPIIRMSMQVREDGYLEQGEYGNDCYVIDNEDLGDDMFKYGVLETDQIICGKNQTRSYFNTLYRESNGLGSGERDPRLPIVGDKLICLKNNHSKCLLNGTMWIVDEVLKITPTFVQMVVVPLDDETKAAVTVSVPVNFFYGTENDLDWKVKKNFDEFCYGYAITVHKCVAPDTLVDTNQGFMEIEKIADTGIVSAVGSKPYIDKFVYDVTDCKVINTVSGYDLTVSNNHDMVIVSDGGETKVKASDVVIGDWVKFPLFDSITRKSVVLVDDIELDVRAKRFNIPNTLDGDFAELIGLMIADGVIFDGGVRLVKRHKDVVERFAELVAIVFGIESPEVKDYKHSNAFIAEVCSVHLSAWLKKNAGLVPNGKFVPDIIKASDVGIQARFIKGLFEDGSASNDHIEFSSEYEHLAKFVHVWLLKCGIISSRRQRRNQWHVYIYNSQYEKFNERIGFIAESKSSKVVHTSKERRYYLKLSLDQIVKIKQAKKDGKIDCMHVLNPDGTITRAKASEFSTVEGLGFLGEMLGFHYEQIKSINDTRSKVMCVEVPDGNMFNQNGILAGNSQGSQYNSVMLWDQSSIFRDARLKHLYTGITRAADKILVVL